MKKHIHPNHTLRCRLLKVVPYHTMYNSVLYILLFCILSPENYKTLINIINLTIAFKVILLLFTLPLSIKEIFIAFTFNSYRKAINISVFYHFMEFAFPQTKLPHNDSF